jgi:DNA-binding response OmpR family regulator
MDASGRVVLIFEDNSSIRNLLTFFFKKLGFAAVTAEDGTEAVELARRHSPALITMDMIMPGKDGLEAVGDLRRAGVTAPIVMLTSKAFAPDRDRALAAGANAYLLKPFNPADLEAVIRPLIAA